MALSPTRLFHVDVTMLLLIPLLEFSGFNVIFDSKFPLRESVIFVTFLCSIS